MTPRSKYTNLSSIPSKFTKDEWELAVSVIEFLPHDLLVKLNTEYGIKFAGGNESMDDESLTTTLLVSDVSEEKTMEIAHKYKYVNFIQPRNLFFSISDNLLKIYKNNKENWSEISSIFMDISELPNLDEDLRLWCMDASVVIGESIYGKGAGMSFEELEAEYKLLQK